MTEDTRAFPMPASEHRADDDFLTRWPAQPGMTLRQWYAGQALAGLCANMDSQKMADIADGTQGGRFYLECANRLADAMIAEDATRESGE